MFMETRDAIRARRNVRQCADRPISPPDLDRILEAGRRAPSANNQQWWDFVVATERARLQNLAKVWRGAAPVATSAATVAIIVAASDDPRTRDLIQFDLGQATMGMMVAAADLGIGSGHATVAVHALDLSTGQRRRVTDHPVGIIEGAPTYEGTGVVWFQDETGDESGQWLHQPFQGGPVTPFLDGVPHGWNEGLAQGPGVTVAVLSDRDGFHVYASVDGRTAKAVFESTEAIAL